LARVGLPERCLDSRLVDGVARLVVRQVGKVAANKTRVHQLVLKHLRQDVEQGTRQGLGEIMRVRRDRRHRLVIERLADLTAPGQLADTTEHVLGEEVAEGVIKQVVHDPVAVQRCDDGDHIAR